MPQPPTGGVGEDCGSILKSPGSPRRCTNIEKWLLAGHCFLVTESLKKSINILPRERRSHFSHSPQNTPKVPPIWRPEGTTISHGPSSRDSHFGDFFSDLTCAQVAAMGEWRLALTRHSYCNSWGGYVFPSQAVQLELVLYFHPGVISCSSHSANYITYRSTCLYVFA